MNFKASFLFKISAGMQVPNLSAALCIFKVFLGIFWLLEHSRVVRTY